MVARKRFEVDLRDGSGRIVKFDAPMNATPAQITTLATRALKQAHPDAGLKRPVLDKQVYGQSKIFDASVSATPDTLRSRAGNKARDIATGVGFSRQTANNIASRTESAIDYVPLAGDAVGADDAATAFKAGRYGEAALGAGATAIGLIPGFGDVAAPAMKAMFLGAKAKNADKAALRTAEQMLADGADKREIWDKTGWFQQHGQWKFEVDDGALRVDSGRMPNPATARQRAVADALAARGITDVGKIDAATHAELRKIDEDAAWDEATRMVPGVIDHPEVAANYPDDFARLTTGWNNSGGGATWSPSEDAIRLPFSATSAKTRSSAAHELQHFVERAEGFPAGANPRTADAMFGSGAYPRVAGEVEARNVQHRLDWTPEQRRATPPWATQEFPDDEQFKIWGGDGAANLGEPSSLSTPRVPTPEEMQRLAQRQNVSLDAARHGNRLDWGRNQRGDYGEPLVAGYADRPVAVQMENGEFVLLDGNHRAAMARQLGVSEMEMDVIPARAYDPENMGKAPVVDKWSNDDLLAELGAPPAPDIQASTDDPIAANWEVHDLMPPR